MIAQPEQDIMTAWFSHVAVVHTIKWMTIGVAFESTVMLIANGQVSDPAETAELQLRRTLKKCIAACDCPAGVAPRLP